MLYIVKKYCLGLTAIICFSCLLLSLVSRAQDRVNPKQFNHTVEQIKELKKTDLAGSLKQLTVYENSLPALTIKQNLLYFKLLTEIYIDQNKYSAAKKSANKGLVIAKSLASPSLTISELLYLKGFAFESLGNTSQATIEYKKGLGIAESLQDQVQVAEGLINLGAIAYLTEDYKRALILLHDAFNIASQTDDEDLKGTANTELGIVYSHLRQDKQSMAYYQQSYLHFKKAGLLRAAHNSLNNIALTHINNKDYQQALAVFNIILAESSQDSPNDSLFSLYSGMAWAYLKQEDSNPDAAYQYLLKAKQYLKTTETLNVQVRFYYDEASVLYKLARFDEALISLATIEKILSSHQELSLISKQSYVNLISLKGSILNKMGRFQRAYKVKSRVIKLTDTLYENEDNRSIAQVRLRLEGEQADKYSKVLQNQNLLYEADLHQAQLENEEQRLYLILSALFALAFAWILVKLIQSQHKLKVASNADSLTGVANRRRLMKKSQALFKFAKIKQDHLSIVMINIDHFKDINEKLGHSVGDKVLAQVATIGANLMRKNDVFGRYGGVEFMVCLPKTPLGSAIDIAERIRTSVSQHSWPFNHLETVNVSIGVATLAADSDLISLIKRADEQLYHAKASGKNKVCGQ
ncbi:tetratricopeptide repeat-containing diguanylate cyclase [Colwellia piezophila]|uniref:tetratricopeptide repeat-containing diguanylate cyclase n=1 Tax=Colwellia piezophila TaxID=211668 RepID=UPI00038054BC|nr:tetratricopeptide repeat-containing diguanylate cyclase [Colwellia piezophila]